MPVAEQKAAPSGDPASAATPRRPLAFLLLILALTLGTRIFMVAHAQNVATDSTTFLAMGKMLFSQEPVGVLRSFKYHPGYSFTVGAIATVSGAGWPDGWIVVGHVVSILAALVAVAAFYYVARNVFDRTVALAATMLLAISPAFTQNSADVLSDTPALAMALLAIAAGFKAAQRCSKESWSGVAYAAAAGLFGGLGYLFRPEHLLGAAIAALLIMRADKGSTGFGARDGTAWRGCATKNKLPVIQVAGVVTLVVAAAAVVLPYAITIGAFTQKKSAEDFAMASGAPILAGIAPPPGAMWVIRTGDLWHSPVNVMLKLLESMGPVALGAVGICVLAWIAAALPRRGRFLPPALVSKPSGPGAIAMFAPAVILLPVLLAMEHHQRGYVTARHLMLPGTLFMPMAGAGVVMLARLTLAKFRGAPGQSLDDRLRHLSASDASFALFLLILAVSSIATRSMAQLHRDKGCYRQEGVLVGNALGHGHYFLSPDGWMPFFAQCPPEQFANAGRMQFNLTPQDLASPDALYARASLGSQKFDYVVAGEDQLRSRASDPEGRAAREKAVQTLKRLGRDPRFALIDRVTYKKDIIWLFRVEYNDDRKN